MSTFYPTMLNLNRGRTCISVHRSRMPMGQRPCSETTADAQQIIAIREGPTKLLN